MADIAAVFHWPPSELKRMSLSELEAWSKLALRRARPGRPVSRRT